MTLYKLLEIELKNNGKSIQDLKRVFIDSSDKIEVELDLETTLNLLKEYTEDQKIFDIRFLGKEFEVTLSYQDTRYAYGVVVTVWNYLNREKEYKKIKPESLHMLKYDSDLKTEIPYRVDLAEKQKKLEKQRLEVENNTIDQIEKHILELKQIIKDIRNNSDKSLTKNMKYILPYKNKQLAYVRVNDKQSFGVVNSKDIELPVRSYREYLYYSELPFNLEEIDRDILLEENYIYMNKSGNRVIVPFYFNDSIVENIYMLEKFILDKENIYSTRERNAFQILLDYYKDIYDEDLYFLVVGGYLNKAIKLNYVFNDWRPTGEKIPLEIVKWYYENLKKEN